METNCAPLVAVLFLSFYERDFMTSLSDDNQGDIIEVFNSTSRYLDDLLTIDNPYFEGMVNQIYPPELQMNRYRGPPFWFNIYLFLMVLFPPKFMIKAMTINFPFLDGDVPRRPSLERSKGGVENILVITDHFSRYAQAIPTRNQTAKTTVRVLFDNFIVHFGFPARIHSDQGQNFESNLIKELCQIARVEKSRTTPYHPMGNGQVERFNQTLLKMLGSQKSDWKTHIPTLVHAYNAMFHDSTGFSLYFLMFGRHPMLAVDAFLGLTPDALSSTSKTEYVRKLKERLDFTYNKAAEEAKRSAAVHKHALTRKREIQF